MSLSRSVVNTTINVKITDELKRQNTAAVVRYVLQTITANYFNLADDELEISHINQLTSILAAKADLVNGKVKIEQLPDVAAYWGTLTKAADNVQTIDQAIQVAIDNLVNAAPEQLNTLNELAAALANNTSMADAITAELALKIPYTEKGVASGVATLNTEGKVPASQLPEAPVYADLTANEADSDKLEGRRLDGSYFYWGFARLKAYLYEKLGFVKTVNGVKPDPAGNVQVSTGTGTGTGGSSGVPSWLIVPRIVLDTDFSVKVLNTSPNEPLAYWPDTDPQVYPIGTVLPALTPPGEGIFRTDAVDADISGKFIYVKGEESPFSATTPALLDNRLRACYILWAGVTGTIFIPEGFVNTVQVIRNGVPESKQTGEVIITIDDPELPEEFNICSLPDLPDPLLDTDVIAVCRGGNHYKTTGAAIKVLTGNTAPSILLTGSNSDTVTQGNNYLDPGATASDPEDGDLTAAIVKTGSIDSNVLGPQTLTYKVTDSGGTTTTVTRTVTVVAQEAEPRLQLSGSGSAVDVSANMSIFNQLADEVTITGFFKSYADMSGAAAGNAYTLFALQSDNLLTGTGSDSFQILYGNASAELTGEVVTVARIKDHGASGSLRSVQGFKTNNSADYANTAVHVGVRITGGVPSIFINGVKRVTTDVLTASSAVVHEPLTRFIGGLEAMVHAHIGARLVNGEVVNSLGGEPWNWRLWNYGRTDAQILEESKGAVYEATEAGLVEQWLVKDAVGPTVNGTKGNDGVIINGSWSTSVAGEGITGETYTGATLG